MVGASLLPLEQPTILHNYTELMRSLSFWIEFIAADVNDGCFLIARKLHIESCVLKLATKEKGSQTALILVLLCMKMKTAAYFVKSLPMMAPWLLCYTMFSILVIPSVLHQRNNDMTSSTNL